MDIHCQIMESCNFKVRVYEIVFSMQNLKHTTANQSTVPTSSSRHVSIQVQFFNACNKVPGWQFKNCWLSGRRLAKDQYHSIVPGGWQCRIADKGPQLSCVEVNGKEPARIIDTIELCSGVTVQYHGGMAVLYTGLDDFNLDSRKYSGSKFCLIVMHVWCTVYCF